MPQHLKPKNYFITAIGTDSGKTLASAIFCQALQADYWKPVQSGLPRDTDVIRKLVSDKKTFLHPEQYFLSHPISPHAAALLDGTPISLDAFNLPHTDNTLIIEGAGGCLVPLNDDALLIDLMARLNAETIVVSNHYLGSINHTLLTVEALNQRGIIIRGIVFNGIQNDETERIILHRTGLECLLRIDREPVIDAATVRKYAMKLNQNWHA